MIIYELPSLKRASGDVKLPALLTRVDENSNQIICSTTTMHFRI